MHLKLKKEKKEKIKKSSCLETNMATNPSRLATALAWQHSLNRREKIFSWETAILGTR
jgi:hypothetical protein